MKCVDRIKTLAASVGAEVDEVALDDGAIIVDAPSGYLWNASGDPALHEVAAQFGQSWWTQAAREIEGAMAMGLRKCSAEESAEHEHLRDEPWTAPVDAPQRLEVTP